MPAPAGPSGELGVLARRQELVAVAGELGQLLDHHGAAGMLIPTASVSVANTTFTRPSTKHASTTSLNGGTMPGVVGGDAGLSWPGTVVAEHGEVGVVESRRGGGRRSRGCASRSSPVGEAQPGVEAGLGGLVALRCG